MKNIYSLFFFIFLGISCGAIAQEIPKTLKFDPLLKAITIDSIGVGFSEEKMREIKNTVLRDSTYTIYTSEFSKMVRHVF